MAQWNAIVTQESSMCCHTHGFNRLIIPLSLIHVGWQMRRLLFSHLFGTNSDPLRLLAKSVSATHKDLQANELSACPHFITRWNISIFGWYTVRVLRLAQIHCELGNKQIFHFRAVKHDNFIVLKQNRKVTSHFAPMRLYTMLHVVSSVDFKAASCQWLLEAWHMSPKRHLGSNEVNVNIITAAHYRGQKVLEVV